MIRNSVKSENVPEVAQALRVHVFERSRILHSLSASFKQDSRIRAAWLWGSFLRGDQDDLSDLDLWLLVPKDCVEELAASMKLYCAATGIVVSSGENAHNAPEGGGYFGALIAGTYGLHHVDAYWQPVSKRDVPATQVLFNRLDEPCPTLGSQSTRLAEEEESPLEACRGRISFVWLMLSVAAKYLARDSSSDMTLMTYPRNAFEETLAILGVRDEIGNVVWTAPDTFLAKVDLLRHVATKTALLEEACRTQGLDISIEANPCLNRYFDLVEGILRSRLTDSEALKA